MSKIVCYEGRFICEHCGMTDCNIYVWSDRKENPKCESCGSQTTEVDKNSNESFTILNPIHKKGRSQKERWERKSTNFRKEMLPTLSGSDRRYFEKKFGKPL